MNSSGSGHSPCPSPTAKASPQSSRVFGSTCLLGIRARRKSSVLRPGFFVPHAPESGGQLFARSRSRAHRRKRGSYSAGYWKASNIRDCTRNVAPRQATDFVDVLAPRPGLEPGLRINRPPLDLPTGPHECSLPEFVFPIILVRFTSEMLGKGRFWPLDIGSAEPMVFTPADGRP